MHEVECSIERNRTLFANAVVVAKDLVRPIDQLVKYIGYDLGTKSQVDKDSGQGSFAGKHSPSCHPPAVGGGQQAGRLSCCGFSARQRGKNSTAASFSMRKPISGTGFTSCP